MYCSYLWGYVDSMSGCTSIEEKLIIVETLVLYMIILFAVY